MIAVVLVIGLILRLVNINQSLWLDEAITAEAISKFSFQEIITIYSPGDFHPPLYYLILKLWSIFAGTSEIALRLPSVFFSLATVWFVFLIGQKIWNKKVGIVAAIFLAINPLAIYYSQEARMYSFVTLLVTLTIYALVAKRWWLFALSLLAVLYTDYVPIFLLPVLFFATPRKAFVYFFLPLIFFLPWGYVLVKQFLVAQASLSQSPEWGRVLGSFDLKALPLTIVKFIIGRISLDNKIVYGITMLVAAVGYGAALLRARSRLLWAWFLVPLVIGLAVSTVVPLFSYFRFLFVLPAFILLLAGGAHKSKVLTLFIIAVSLISLSVFNLQTNFQREDWRRTTEYINSHPGIVAMPSVAQNAPLLYYSVNSPVVDSPEELTGERIYLLRYVQEIFDPQDQLRTTLEQKGYLRIDERHFNGIVVWTYEMGS